MDFKASGTTGNCIEGREFIIALPEHFVEYEPDDVVRLFTDSFRKRYDVECSVALHYNKKMTNYHIHLVFSERKILEHPEVKIATRNMFYDEQGKHRQTKNQTAQKKKQTSDPPTKISVLKKCTAISRKADSSRSGQRRNPETWSDKKGGTDYEENNF